MNQELNNILTDPVITILEIQVTKYEIFDATKVKDIFVQSINPFDLFMH